MPDPDNQRTWWRINLGTITILSKAFQALGEGAKSADLPEDVLTRSLDQISRYASSLSVELPPLADVTETVQGASGILPYT